MMQPAHFANGDNLAGVSALNSAWLRGILPKREMGPRLVVIGRSLRTIRSSRGASSAITFDRGTRGVTIRYCRSPKYQLRHLQRRVDNLEKVTAAPVACHRQADLASWPDAVGAQSDPVGPAGRRALSTGAGAGQSSPASATRRRRARRPSGALGRGRSHLLDRAACDLGRLEHLAGDRDTRHRRGLAQNARIVRTGGASPASQAGREPMRHCPISLLAW